MPDPEKTEATEANPQTKPSQRRGRRRGGRGRSRAKHSESAAPSSLDSAEPIEETKPPNGGVQEAPIDPAIQSQDAQPPRRQGSRSQERAVPHQALAGAKRQADQIIESLQQALEEMEQLRRLLDQVDQERGDDLRELESLRRTLNQMQSLRGDSKMRHGR